MSRLPDLGGPLRLRHRYLDPVAGRDTVVRDQAAADDGRDLRGRRPMVIDPAHAHCLKAVTDGATAGSVTGLPELPAKLAPAERQANPAHAPLGNMAISANMLVSILFIAKFAKGFVANDSVLLAIVIGVGMIPLVAPNFNEWMPHGIHQLIESGIFPASASAVILNAFFNEAQGSVD